MMCFRHRLAILSLALITPAALAATPPSNWWSQARAQLQQHPNWQATQARHSSTQASAEQAALPRFNPELEGEWQRSNGQRSYQVGLNQELDVWNSRQALQQQAQQQVTASHATNRWRQLQQWINALSSEVNWQAARQQQQLAEQQQQRLLQLQQLIQRRQQQGDVGQLDAELAFLSLSEQRLTLAQSQQQQLQAEQQRRWWLGQLDAAPEQAWQQLKQAQPEFEVDQHPLLQTAKAHWQAQQATALAAQRDRRSRPTLGLTVGKEDQQTVSGLNLSLPLNVRNDYAPEQRALQQQALALEADYRGQRRQLLQQWQQAQQNWRNFDQQWQQWRQHSQQRLSHTAELLRQRWQQGDLSSADYLRSLNQLAASQRAGIELQRQARLANLQRWLSAGQLPTFVLPAATVETHHAS
ncbi:hypothetical protein GCM10011297_05380 [Bacterioplanes sanyensis]|uniref:TolC family protein n=1 Tax=Bacterioplanes sanyensis TaxID=1249553 RepID=UPI001676DF1F|nr:TolC family protein [Bacterioplanes sanyensis]GGY35236.1 hypothetical protein GCM10011297_05380 [Bacterioplanes sanyensis]